VRRRLFLNGIKAFEAAARSGKPCLRGGRSRRTFDTLASLTAQVTAPAAARMPTGGEPVRKFYRKM